MKKILNALFVASLAVFTFSSCSDVPAPYEIIDSNNQGGNGGTEVPPLNADDPFGLNATNPVATLNETFEDVIKFKDFEKTGWVNKALQQKNLWQGNDGKYIQASPYRVDNGKTMEAWVITPALTINKDNKFTFSSSVSYWSEKTSLKVFFLEKQADGKVKQTEILVPAIPASSNYEWVHDITVDLTEYEGKVGFVGFQYKTVSTGASNRLSTYKIDNIKYDIPSQGGGQVDPAPQPGVGTDLLTNGGFENWKDDYPTNWKSESGASSAKISESTDFKSGSKSVLVKGDTKNTRLASHEMTLKAGTYVFSGYFKVAADPATVRMGFVDIKPGFTVGTYTYPDNNKNTITNTDWKQLHCAFTLKEETTVCLLIMNSKDTQQKDFLVDDVRLETTDGGIVEKPVIKTTYTKVTEIVSGSEYLITAMNEGVCKFAYNLPGDKNYGYLKTSNATLSNDEVTIEREYSSFIIKAVEGGYTIQQPFDNRYLIMKGSNNNTFNLEKSVPTSGNGHIWKITTEADGTMKIVNAETNKYFQYDDKYTSFGAYDTQKGTLPTLFVKK